MVLARSPGECARRGSDGPGDQIRHRLVGRRAGGAANEAHASPVGHRIDDVRPVEKPCLEAARRLARRRNGDETAPGRLVGHLLGQALGEHVALMQHDDATAALRLIEIGGAEQDRQSAIGDQAPHDVPQFAPRQGIDPDGGLVEQQQLRRADKRAGQAELLFHAARQPAGETRGKGLERGHRHELRIELRPLRRAHPVQVRV